MTQDMTQKMTIIKKTLMMVLMVAFGTNVSWGQINEGLYYIKSNAGQTYYLCPAIGCYYNNNVDHPHLTTFETDGDQNSIWEVKSAETVGNVYYYYLIHHKTGKYLKSNEGFSIDGGSNRKAVHLEDKPSSLDEYYEFCIKNNSGTYQIYPKKYDSNASSMSFNCRGGNQAYYFPQNGLAMGIVGLFDSSNAGSKWKFTAVAADKKPCATPIIKYDGDNINISYPYSDETGITIYYTTDGSDPSTTSSSNSSTSFDISASGVIKVRAFAAKTGLVNSDEAVLWGSARPFLIQSKECEDYYLVPTSNGTNVNTSSLPGTSMQWTLQNAGVSTGGVQYYYVVNSNNKKINYNSSDNSLTLNEESADNNKFCIVENGYNTGGYFLMPISLLSKWVYKNKGNVEVNNVAAADMKDPTKDSTFPFSQWKFRECNSGTNQKSLFSAPPLSVSNDDETHYYHIQCLGKEGYYIIPPSDPDGYVAISNTSGDYTDVPWVIKEATSDNWLTYYYIINAATGKYMYFNGNNNLTDKLVNAISMKEISESTAATEEKYQFVLVWSTTANACYIVPKISVNYFLNSKYYGIWYDDANTTVLKTTWSRSFGANNVKWTFNEAAITELYLDAVISQDENGYISITHPTNACDFYYTIDGTTDPVIPVSGEPTSPTYKYNGPFLPPLGTTKIKAKAAIKGDHSKTSGVVEYDLPALTSLAISFDNTTSEVTIASLTGATIYYAYGSTDPADPTVDESVTHGLSPITFPISDKTYVKAIAVKEGFTPSAVQSITIDKVAAPVIDITSDGKVKLTSNTPGVTIYYEIGDDASSVATPTTSSTRYTTPLSNVSGKVIKAIAVRNGWINSDIGGSEGPIFLQCAMPVIRRGTGKTFTLSCSFPTEGVTIYYTTDGADLVTDPTSGTAYTVNTEIPFTGTSVTVKAIAVADGYNNSAQAERTITEALSGSGTAEDPYLIESSGDFAQFISKANGTGSGDYYKVTDDFTVGPTDAITTAFTGTFDGGYHVISSLGKPLFNSINGGTVKNVVLNPNGTVNGNGAICNEAAGATKIYNCGVLPGTISGSGNVGGLVGHIASGSSVRVINCYNYATVSGGTTMAGIVGNNEGTVGAVRIAMCMMYGNMSGGTSPVYAGNHTSNASNFTEYNYWRSKANLTYTTYNDQLAIDKDDYLTRFPFYRHILNTHRELAAYFLFAANTTEGSVSAITDNQISEIGHWVLNKDVAPYPVVEKWEINTTKTLDTAANTDNILVDMGNGGYLSVSVKIGSNTYSASLPITDMDEANYDYTWGKVVLPFANEFEKNTDYSKICTGWKITGITGGTTGSSFSKYDVSDRDCTSKDLYSTTGFVFAQGGNYIVPYNVTDIEITANFATAYYLRDEAYDIGYSGDKTGSNVSGYKGRTGLGGSTITTPNTYQGQPVYNTLAAALDAMSASGSTHEQAVVLVGNYHQDDENLLTPTDYTTKGLTIMSIDADNNQEPDYAWYSNNTQDRPAIPPTRFDFVALIPVGMSSRVNNTTFYPGIPIWKPRGWFEMTETSLSRMDQFELNSNNFNTSESDTRNYRCIINGGYFTQMVRSRKAACSKVKYYQIGGKAYVKEFYPGSHSADSYATILCPINVTGGEIEQCFMTGFGTVTDTKAATAIGSDIYFWCAGGKIDKFLGAYMEKPRQTTTSDGKVNMTAKIDHAKIGKFFGGGTSPKAQISGDIDVTINNSHVDFYCGGPEFGDIGVTNSAGVTTSFGTVTTHATGTVFGEYYGAGFGGTAITYTNDEDDNNQGLGSAKKPTVPYPSSFFTTHYVANRLNNTSNGIGSCYKFEFIFNSRGSGSVARFYTGYAKFSLATTGNVTNELDGCTMLGDFYGAGCQGKVSGTVTSTLTGCTINGSAFGGGYKAENNIVDVYPETEPTMSVYTRETGIFSDFGTVAPVKFEWKQDDASHAAGSSDDEGGTLYTDVTMSDLGNVTGAISLTIDGGSVGDNVFGGGNESKSKSDATVNIKGGTIIHDVYGGGNVADVNGNTKVMLLGGIVNGDVYGGGKGRMEKGALTDADYVSPVAATVGSTKVCLNGIEAADYDEAKHSSWGLAEDYTVPDANKGCIVKGSIFGCNNLNGTPKGQVTVHIFKTQRNGATRITNTEQYTEAKVFGEKYTEGKNKGNYNLSTFDVQAVYGGGNLAAYVPDPTTANDEKTRPAATVIIDGCDKTSIGQVYGGGNAASTPATSVTVNGTFEIGEVFGGGNGKDDISKDGGVTWIKNPGANVGFYEYKDDQEDTNTAKKRADNYGYGSGAASVNIYGGKIHSVFGGSNTKGNVRITAVTLLEEKSDTEGAACCEFDVDEAYGGGKSAPMDAEAKLLMQCIPGLKEAYGGAEAADIQGNVALTITNGTFNRVFGGNNLSGTIRGSITVNIEETGCKPIIIGELYGGGNEAGYSVRGYKQVTEGEGVNAVTKWVPRTADDALEPGMTAAFADPQVNVKSFASIGQVFGGGYGENAVMVGNPTVNINEVVGQQANTAAAEIADGEKVRDEYPVPSHAKGKIGAINNVFGGGNAAKVIGNTIVNVGTLEKITYVSVEDDPDTTDVDESVTEHTVIGADIRGNVYGGGNNAEVTGNTNVNIGRKVE